MKQTINNFGAHFFPIKKNSQKKKGVLSSQYLVSITGFNMVFLLQLNQYMVLINLNAFGF